MQVIINPSNTEILKAITRPLKSIEEIEKEVSPVLKSVKENGDSALKDFTFKFDKFLLQNIQEIGRAHV